MSGTSRQRGSCWALGTRWLLRCSCWDLSQLPTEVQVATSNLVVLTMTILFHLINPDGPKSGQWLDRLFVLCSVTWGPS